jgi:hypothetical protein
MQQFLRLSIKTNRHTLPYTHSPCAHHERIHNNKQDILFCSNVKLHMVTHVESGLNLHFSAYRW